MWSYNLKCGEKTGSKNPKVVKTKNIRIMFIPNCATCTTKKSRFIKKEKARVLLSSLGMKTALSRIPLEGHLLL